MEDLLELERLSLVNKICSELENHIGISDKVLGIGRTNIQLNLSLMCMNRTPIPQYSRRLFGKQAVISLIPLS